MMLAGIGLALTGCRADSAKGSATAAAPPQSNRIDVPELVRQNLGIEFATVERRRVAATLRLPGRIELLPGATREYRAPLPGRVAITCESLQRVSPGDLLYTIDSPDWRQQQRELGDLDHSIDINATRLNAMQPLLAACEQHEASLRRALKITQDYLVELESAQANVGGQNQRLADARVQAARLESQIAEASEKHTETETRIAELRATAQTLRQRRDLLLAGIATTLAIDPAELADGDNWRRIGSIEVRASASGVVVDLTVTNGGIVDTHGAVVTVVDPAHIRCRTRALQSDLAKVTAAVTARIVPAGGNGAASRASGTVLLGPVADPRRRTIDVFVTPTESAEFLRPGMAVFVELESRSDAASELAIPQSAVLPDGLDRVLFRRDPRDPDKVIRVVADLGASDGVWVEVKSGLIDGDQVVTSGAFELVLASSGSTPKGGHFHADGTWHEDHE